MANTANTVDATSTASTANTAITTNAANIPNADNTVKSCLKTTTFNTYVFDGSNGMALCPWTLSC